MQKKILVLLGVLSLVAVFAQASVYNGSVPNRGSRFYTFTPDFSGIAILSLIYESRTADLDLRLAARDENNELVAVAFSESELQRQELLQIGVLGGAEYTIIVFSSSGPSPYRLSFESTFTTASAIGQAGTSSGGAQLREIQPDAALLKFVEETRRHSLKFKNK
jgi:hypothetical protein